MRNSVVEFQLAIFATALILVFYPVARASTDLMTGTFAGPGSRLSVTGTEGECTARVTLSRDAQQVGFSSVFECSKTPGTTMSFTTNRTYLLAENSRITDSAGNLVGYSSATNINLSERCGVGSPEGEGTCSFFINLGSVTDTLTFVYQKTDAIFTYSARAEIKRE